MTHWSASLMAWKLPWISSFGSDLQLRLRFRVHRGGDRYRGEHSFTWVDFPKLLAEAPDRLQQWAEAVGTDVVSGLAEGPRWNAFALSDCVLNHTYSRYAADGELPAPYYYPRLDQVSEGPRRRRPGCGATRNTRMPAPGQHRDAGGPRNGEDRPRRTAPARAREVMTVA